MATRRVVTTNKNEGTKKYDIDDVSKTAYEVDFAGSPATNDYRETRSNRTVTNPGTLQSLGVSWAPPVSNPPAPSPAPAPAPTAPGGEQLPPPPTVTPNAYTVQKGDSLSAVAQANGLSLRELIDLNPQYRANPNMVQVGANLKLPPKITPPNVPQQSQDIVQNYINEGNRNEDEGPQVDKISSYLNQVNSALKPNSQAPAPFNPATAYDSLREQYGIGGLEAELNTIRAQQQALTDEITSQKNKAKGDLVSTSVINGRLVKIDAETRDAINELQRKEAVVVDQLNTKNKVVGTMMDLTQKSYDNARQEYEFEFNKNVKAFELVRGIQRDQLTDDERRKDDARANLQIIYGQLSSGSLSQEKITPTMQAEITKNELIAGLPVGFFKGVQDNNPDGNIISTTERTSGGFKYIDTLVRDKQTGQVRVESYKMGPASSGTGESQQDKEDLAAVSIYEATLQKAIAEGATPDEAKLAAQIVAANTGVTLDVRNVGALLVRAQQIYNEVNKSKGTENNKAEVVIFPENLPGNNAPKNLDFSVSPTATNQFTNAVSNYLTGTQPAPPKNLDFSAKPISYK